MNIFKKKKKKQPKSTKVKSIENKVVFQPNFLKSLYTKFALICFECLNIQIKTFKYLNDYSHFYR